MFKISILYVTSRSRTSFNQAKQKSNLESREVCIYGNLNELSCSLFELGLVLKLYGVKKCSSSF